MKSIRAMIAVLLALILASPAAAAVGSAADTQGQTLRFNADGQFKIMLFADSQDDENLEATTTQIMCEALDRYKPDLVIYLGDNTVAQGYDNQAAAIKAVTQPVVDRSVPFAIVFGNHDQEQGVSKEDLLEIYQSFGCLTYDADPALYGCGNCNLPIYSSDGSQMAFNLWLIDSGSNNTDEGGPGGYDYVHPDQLDWYKARAAELAAANGGKPVPAMDFQHIVIPEIYDALYVELPFSLGALSQEHFGKQYSLIPVFTRLNGYWLEQCCPPDVYDGQLDAWKEAGDVIAEFHGHDHCNSFEVNIEGVDVINVPTVGCNSYSKDINRGVGLITLNEKDPTNYQYELIRMFDLALQDGSQISSVEGGKSRTHYAFMKALDSIVQVLFRAFRAIDQILPQ